MFYPQDGPTSSNDYIAADRLYDLNPMPPLMMSSLDGPSSAGVGPARSNGAVNDPASLLQFSAAYGNPYLQHRPDAARWTTQRPLSGSTAAFNINNAAASPYDVRPDPPPYSAIGRNKRKTANNVAAAAVTGSSHVVGAASSKRQTLATHV